MIKFRITRNEKFASKYLNENNLRRKEGWAIAYSTGKGWPISFRAAFCLVQFCENHFEKVSYITMRSKCGWCRLKSPSSRLLTQPFIHGPGQRNIKFLHHWPLWDEVTGDRWNPRAKGQWHANVSIWRHRGLVLLPPCFGLGHVIVLSKKAMSSILRLEENEAILLMLSFGG